MSRNSELVKNTFWISMAQIMAQTVNFLFIPLYTGALSTAEYGMVDLYAVIRSILSCILFLGLEHAIFRFCISEDNMQKKREFFSVGVLTAFILLFICSLLYWAGCIIWEFPLARAVYAYYFFYLLFYFLQQTARGLERTSVYAVSSALGTVLAVMFDFILVVCFKYGVVGFLVGSAAAYMFADIYMMGRLPLRKMFMLKWEKRTVRIMLGYSLPLVLNNVTGWVVTSSDRFIITALLGSEMNGIYALACKAQTVLSVLTNGFTMAWAETAVKAVKQADHTDYYRKIVGISLDGFFAISSGMIVVFPFLFQRFINEEYINAYYHIPIIVYATFWYTASSITGYILLAYGKSTKVGMGTLWVGVINLAVHFLLIDRIGLFAASVSTLVSYTALFAFRYHYMQHCENIPFPWSKALVQLSIYLALCVCYYTEGKRGLWTAVFIYAGVIFILIKKYENVLIGVVADIKNRIKGITGEN